MLNSKGLSSLIAYISQILLAFKSLNLKGLSLLFVLVFLTSGCIKRAGKPAPNDNANSTADFRVNEIDFETIEEKKSAVWASIPTSKTYEFRACLIGRATVNQIPKGQEFMVIFPDGTAKKTQTDDLGCANWQETVDFNFASDSVYLRKSRRLRSNPKKSNYKGEIQLEIGVNPWLPYRNDAGKEVIDLNRSSIAQNQIISETDVELLRRGFRNNDDSSAKIIIDPKFEFDIIRGIDIQNGKRLQMIARVRPRIEAKNLRGDIVPFPLTTGNYRVFAQLASTKIGDKADQHGLLTPQVLPKAVTIANSGILTLDLTFDLVREIHMGNVQLALRIEAIGAPYTLRAYEGLHQVGTFRSILETGVSTQVAGNFSATDFKYGEFIRTATNFEDLKASGHAADLEPVIYDIFDPRFIRIKSGETSTERTLLYQVSTIVRDGITGDPVVGQNFRIKKLFTNTEVVRTSDRWGRLIWHDELSHLYYKPEQYYFPKFEITQVASEHTFSQAIAVNPWDFGWTFGVDIRGQEEEYRKYAEKRVNPPEFLIDAFRYQTIRFRYVIDEYLTLNVKKAVVMALDPLVERNTINEGRKYEPLRNGIYLVKIALVKYYIDPFQNNTKLVKIDPNSPDASEKCPITEDEKLNMPFPKVPVDNTPLSSDYPTETPPMANQLPDAGYRLESVSCNGEARYGQYTTVIKKLLRVQAGRITTPLEFSMRDLRMMSIRSNIMVQLETIDEIKLLRDNIVNAKLDELVEEYYELKTEGMTPEAKAEFLAEKRAEQLAEAKKLQASMAEGLEQIKVERETLNLKYQERHEKLSALVDSMGSIEAAKSTDTYRENIEKPEQEFIAQVNEARSSLNKLHLDIENYWGDYEKSWQEGQLKVQEQNGLLPIPLEQLNKRPTYYDYLASMQTFYSDLDIGLTVTNSDLASLEINDYSDTPLVPLVDLNYYIKDSGLAKRTFIGPCTLVANDNMSEMRPTDKIDEADSEDGNIDNSQQVYVPLLPPADNREFEMSAYHDSLIPFKDMHVDDIIPMHIENEKQYEREMKVLSQMGRYVKAFNLQYVSLTDQPLQDFKSGCDLVHRTDCFENQTENVTLKNDFLGALNNVDEEELLSRYFYVRPPNSSSMINPATTQERTLEPLWSRTKREVRNFFRSENDRWMYGDSYKKVLVTNRNTPSSLIREVNDYHAYADSFLRNRYSNLSPQVTPTHITQWLNHGAQNLTLMEALKICSVMTKQISDVLLQENMIATGDSRDPRAKKTPEEYLLEYCFSKIHHISENNIASGRMKLQAQVSRSNVPADRVLIEGITFDRRRRIVRTGAYEHKAGKNTNLNVGVDFSVARYEDTNTMTTLGGNGAALLGMTVAGIGAGVGAMKGAAIGAALTGPAAPVGGAIGAVAGAAIGVAANSFLTAQKGISSGDGVNMTSSTSVSMATFLVIQKAEEDITLEEYEKCLSFQFMPDAIDEMKLEYLQLLPGVESGLVREALSRGYFICEGKITDEPIKVRENYYYITQHFTAGDMLDDVNLLNHVWLLALRGERDFNAFIRTMEGREIGPEGEAIEQNRLYDYSLSRLSYVYGRVIPTFPGMYSIQDPLPIHTGQPRRRRLKNFQQEAQPTNQLIQEPTNTTR